MTATDEVMPMRRMLRRLGRLGAFLAAIYLLFLGLLYFAQDALLFYPMPESRAASAFEEHRITFEHDGVLLSGWFVESPDARGTIVYYGGNGEELSRTLSAVTALGDYDFLLMNYRGYGNSEGSPSEPALKADAAYVLNEMVERGEVDRSRTHLMGRSLGSGIAIWLAAQEDFASLVLISPFDSIASLAAHYYPIFPVEALIAHPFRSIEHADEIDEPMLVIKAESDAVVPHEHTDRFVRALTAPATVAVLEGTSHNRMYLPAFYARVNEFLEAQTAPE